MNNKSKKYFILFILGAVLLAAVFVISITAGSADISPKEAMLCILSPDSADKTTRTIIMSIRLPRTAAALISGACLSVAGLMLQIFFNNPVAEPYILGISSGSTLFLAIVILGGYTFGLERISPMGMVAGSFLGAFTVTVIIILISQLVRSTQSLLIIGIMTGYVCSAFTNILTMLADKERIAEFSLRTMGSFSGATREQVTILLVCSAPFILLSFLMSKQLNAMLLGESYARSMGVSVRIFRLLTVLISGVLTAAVTAFSGAVSFIGLAVPHIVRKTFKTSDARAVIPGCVIYGAALTGICDLAARTVLPSAEIPLGAVTAIIGAPIAISSLLGKDDNGS